MRRHWRLLGPDLAWRRTAGRTWRARTTTRRARPAARTGWTHRARPGRTRPATAQRSSDRTAGRTWHRRVLGGRPRRARSGAGGPVGAASRPVGGSWRIGLPSPSGGPERVGTEGGRRRSDSAPVACGPPASACPSATHTTALRRDVQTPCLAGEGVSGSGPGSVCGSDTALSCGLGRQRKRPSTCPVLRARATAEVEMTFGQGSVFPWSLILPHLFVAASHHADGYSRWR